MKLISSFFLLFIFLANISIANAGDLIIKSVQMGETPQTGDWNICFKAQSGDSSAVFHPDQKYSGVPVPISMDLILPNIKSGDKVAFRTHLDNNNGIVCGPKADDQSSGEFAATKQGSQHYSFEDGDWEYEIYWELKE